MRKLKLFVLLSLLILLSPIVKAQRKTSFGLEGAICRDLHKIQDVNNNLQILPLNSFLGGVRLRHEIGHNALAEVGLLFKSYVQAFTFQDIKTSTSIYQYYALLVPLKLGYKFKLEEYYLVPAVGFTVGVKLASSPHYNRANGYFAFGRTIIESSFEENNAVSRDLIMAQPSIAIERTVFGSVLVSVSATRAFGFSKVHQMDATYTINNSAPMHGTGQSRGDYWSWGVALMYPISNIWQKD